MDWTKAKNILIIALILTNLILIYSVFIQRDKPLIGAENALYEHLKSKNIYVETTIPTKVLKLPVLTVSEGKTDETLVEEVLAGQKSLPTDEITKENLVLAADNFLISCGFKNDNVALDKVKIKKDRAIVTYKNLVNDFILEDSFMNCIFEKGKLVKLERRWLDPGQFGNQKQMAIPASAALLEFANNIGGQSDESEEPVYITDIEIIYWLDGSAFDSTETVTDTALPAWKITYNSGKVSHISAYK